MGVTDVAGADTGFRKGEGGGPCNCKVPKCGPSVRMHATYFPSL